MYQRKYCTTEMFDAIAADTKISSVGRECAHLVVVGAYTLEAAARFGREQLGARVQPSQIGVWAAMIRKGIPEEGKRFVSRSTWFGRWFDDRLEPRADAITWSKELRDDYGRWAERNGAPHIYQVMFQQMLAGRGAVREGSRTVLAGFTLRAPAWHLPQRERWDALDRTDAPAPGLGDKAQRQMLTEEAAGAAQRAEEAHRRYLTETAIANKAKTEAEDLAETARRRALIVAAVNATRSSIPLYGIAGATDPVPSPAPAPQSEPVPMFAPTGRIVK